MANQCFSAPVFAIFVLNPQDRAVPNELRSGKECVEWPGKECVWWPCLVYLEATRFLEDAAEFRGPVRRSESTTSLREA
jgi:hypothetical protein